MIKTVFSFIIIGSILTSCTKESDPFLISKTNIGLLTDSTQVKELKEIYTQDSIVFGTDTNTFSNSRNDIEIFDITGKPLLLLTANNAQDSTSTINNIRILDARYRTSKGLNTLSTFGDIQSNYKVSNIENTIRNVVVFVNEIDAFFTIDKNELPGELQFNSDLTIEATQIPEKAKIKYFMIGWN